MGGFGSLSLAQHLTVQDRLDQQQEAPVQQQAQQHQLQQQQHQQQQPVMTGPQQQWHGGNAPVTYEPHLLGANATNDGSVDMGSVTASYLSNYYHRENYQSPQTSQHREQCYVPNDVSSVNMYEKDAVFSGGIQKLPPQRPPADYRPPHPQQYSQQQKHRQNSFAQSALPHEQYTESRHESPSMRPLGF